MKSKHMFSLAEEHEPHRGTPTPVDFTAPLPLGWVQACRMAVEHWNAGCSAATITYIMSRYHGFKRAPDTWRNIIRENGGDRHRNRGSRQFGGTEHKAKEPSGLAQYLAGTIDGPGGSKI